MPWKAMPSGDSNALLFLLKLKPRACGAAKKPPEAIFTFGTYCMACTMSTMPFSATNLSDITDIEIGTSRADCFTFCAVTVTSSNLYFSGGCCAGGGSLSLVATGTVSGYGCGDAGAEIGRAAWRG